MQFVISSQGMSNWPSLECIEMDIFMSFKILSGLIGEVSSQCSAVGCSVQQIAIDSDIS